MARERSPNAFALKLSRNDHTFRFTSFRIPVSVPAWLYVASLSHRSIMGGEHRAGLHNNVPQIDYSAKVALSPPLSLARATQPRYSDVPGWVTTSSRATHLEGFCLFVSLLNV